MASLHHKSLADMDPRPADGDKVVEVLDARPGPPVNVQAAPSFS